MYATESEQIIRIKYTNSTLTEETRFRGTILLTAERASNAHEHFVVLCFYLTQIPLHDINTHFLACNSGGNPDALLQLYILDLHTITVGLLSLSLKLLPTFSPHDAG